MMKHGRKYNYRVSTWPGNWKMTGNLIQIDRDFHLDSTKMRIKSALILIS